MNPTRTKYKEQKKQDKIITKRTKNIAKKKKSNDDKPDYRLICYEARGLNVCDFVGCDLCGSEAVDCHHILGRIGPKKYDKYNLALLCRACHHKITFEGANTQEMKQNLLEIVKNKLGK